MDDLPSTRHLMDLLQLDRTTICRMLNDDRLPGLRVGAQRCFSRESIEAQMQGAYLPARLKNVAEQAERFETIWNATRLFPTLPATKGHIMGNSNSSLSSRKPSRSQARRR